MPFTTIGQLADRFGVPPRCISDLFYAQKLNKSRCKIMAGRKLIPDSYVDDVEKALIAAGKLEHANV